MLQPFFQCLRDRFDAKIRQAGQAYQELLQGEHKVLEGKNVLSDRVAEKIDYTSETGVSEVPKIY